MGWTSRNVGVTVLLAMEQHRKEAGQRLVALREAKGWNQEDLAHHANLSVKTISRFENGRHDGRRDTVRKLAKALEVEPSEIVGDPPPPLAMGARTQLDDLARDLQSLRDDMDRLLDFLGVSEGEEIAEEGVGPMRLATEHAASSTARSSSARKRRAK